MSFSWRRPAVIATSFMFVSEFLRCGLTAADLVGGSHCL
jgi:hypothetical protein